MDLASLIERGDLGPWHRESDDEYKVRCPNPEHSDRSPSCFFNTTKQVFICFSCGAKGHASVALRWLNITETLDKSDAPVKKVRKDTHYVDDRVLYAWSYEPTEWVAEGFDLDVLSDHQIGFDVLNQRITVPIRDRYGRLIAVSGRAVQDGQKPRYKIYKREFCDFLPSGYEAAKGNVLWRQHLLPKVCDHIVVVEGFKAAMWLVQHGHQNVVATMGKNVTDVQEGLLRALRRPIYIMFDGDEAGRKGAEALGINLYRAGVSVRYVHLPDGQSPDDLNSGQITTALAEAVPHMKRSRPHGNMVSTSPILPTSKSREGHGRRRKRIPLQ
jgi:DNA primase